MPKLLPIPNGATTCSEAKTADENMLVRLSFANSGIRHFVYLANHEDEIIAIVARHVGVKTADVSPLPPMVEWLHGSFNVGIPFTVKRRRSRTERRVLIRFPLPYKIGESFRPGNADEKIRCEAATYAWVDENCPDVPITHLWGFALSSGQTFAAAKHECFIKRCVHWCRRWILSVLGYELPSRYIPLGPLNTLSVGYLLLDFVEKSEGKVLTYSWDEGRHDKLLRGNFFKGLSQIILSLAKVPLPRIGSFTINDSGYISLSNRALHNDWHQAENENIPIDVPRDLTHDTTEPYVLDLLRGIRARVYHQPNGVHHYKDSFRQISSITVMEAVFLHFFDRNLRRGPFALMLTDLHHSNIFVDDQWHIKRIVDLEWACSRPIEMLHPPYWLNGDSIDTIDASAYGELHHEFTEAIGNEERARHVPEKEGLSPSQVMRKGWESGNFWFCLSLNHHAGLNSIFYKQIQPIFSRTHGEETQFYTVMPRYWCRDIIGFTESKLQDQKEYEEKVSELFAEGADTQQIKGPT